MITSHSKYGASKFETLMLCAGKLRMEQGLPNKSSKYSAEGTVAHTVLEAALLNKDYQAMLGEIVEVDGFKIVINDEMISHAKRTSRNMLELSTGALIQQAETKVNYAVWLGVAEHEGWGTADFCALMPDGTLQVHDFKYGRGVAVDVEDNVQLTLYALGCYEMFKDFIDITNVVMYIHQPRLQDEPQVFERSMESIVKWVTEQAQPAVTRIEAVEEMPSDMLYNFLTPGEKQCRFCKARPTCARARDEVFSTVFQTRTTAASPDEFEVMTTETPMVNPRISDNEWLSAIIPKLEGILGWCSAVQEAADARVLAGQNINGLKVVNGKKGNRAWEDEGRVEAMLKAARVRRDVIYQEKLVSPTEMEKRFKEGLIMDRIWGRLGALITQAEGKPTVVPTSDKRPAISITAAADEFEPVTLEEAAGIPLPLDDFGIG